MAARRLSIFRSSKRLARDLEESRTGHGVAVASNPAFKEPVPYRADEAERKYDPHCKFEVNPRQSRQWTGTSERTKPASWATVGRRRYVTHAGHSRNLALRPVGRAAQHHAGA